MSEILVSEDALDYIGSFERIAELVCAEPGLSRELLASRTRRQPIAQWRQVLMYLLAKADYTSMLAGILLGRNHATVLHAVRAVRNRMSTEPQFKETISRLEKQLL